MNKEILKEAKRNILRCLTEDFEYGTRKDGAPLKRKKRNQAIFDKDQGFACFNGTDLEMVMDAVMLGLYFTLDDKHPSQNKIV